MVEEMAVVFGDFVWKMVWVEAKRLMAFMVGLDGGDLHIPSEDFVFSCIGNEASRPLGL